jgi:hypothetical protein
MHKLYHREITPAGDWRRSITLCGRTTRTTRAVARDLLRLSGPIFGPGKTSSWPDAAVDVSWNSARLERRRPRRITQELDSEIDNRLDG